MKFKDEDEMADKTREVRMSERLIPDALSMSLQMLDENRRKRALEEAQEREWPSVLLEDLLDAEEVKERTTYPISIINIGGTI